MQFLRLLLVMLFTTSLMLPNSTRGQVQSIPIGVEVGDSSTYIVDRIENDDPFRIFDFSENKGYSFDQGMMFTLTVLNSTSSVRHFYDNNTILSSTYFMDFSLEFDAETQENHDVTIEIGFIRLVSLTDWDRIHQYNIYFINEIQDVITDYTFNQYETNMVIEGDEVSFLTVLDITIDNEEGLYSEEEYVYNVHSGFLLYRRYSTVIRKLLFNVTSETIVRDVLWGEPPLPNQSSNVDKSLIRLEIWIISFSSVTLYRSLRKSKHRNFTIS